RIEQTHWRRDAASFRDGGRRSDGRPDERYIAQLAARGGGGDCGAETKAPGDRPAAETDYGSAAGACDRNDDNRLVRLTQRGRNLWRQPRRLYFRAPPGADGDGSSGSGNFAV